MGGEIAETLSRFTLCWNPHLDETTQFITIHPPVGDVSAVTTEADTGGESIPL